VFKKHTEVVEAPKGKLVAQMMPPMRVVETFAPLSITSLTSPSNGWSKKYIFDFGINLVGNCTLKVPVGLPDGTVLTIRHAETLQEDGTLYTANLRGAKCRDIYIANGKMQNSFSYTPKFTYHGFRYAELTGLPENVKPDKETLTARAINTDLPKVGKFETSNETLNAVFRNVYRGTQGNYLSIPTDCPQRDERQGWQGDRAGESKGEMFLFDNITLYSKWLIDIEDSQREDGNLSDVCPNFWPLYGSNVTWPSAFTIIPDSIYVMYGDKRPIERHYEAMKRWLIGHLGQFVKDGIIAKDNYGDWCVPPEKPELIHSQDPARKTSKEILATSYYIYNLDLLTKYAKMLRDGRRQTAEGIESLEADIKLFEAKAAEMRKAFNDKFLNEETGKYDNGTQTSCVLPLYFNIVPDDMKQKVFTALVDNIENVTKNHIGTGLIGGQWLNRVLSDNGKADISYLFASNKDYPSWGYMVEKGATAIWELWNGDTADPAMNSGNHVMLVGDLIIWFYEYLAGIKADENKPGFEHIIMKPLPLGDLKFVNAEYNSIRGVIKSKWNRDGNKFHWEIEIPVGSTATVILPDGKKIENVQSGQHIFDAVIK
ncbi:MAG: glycoside hydrolase family 78 protein, partial [Planctomycetaceae bacterium]|nr:glycoside hydrolase family 78 protein [Planctomycetaceae bacterium]